MKHIYVLNRCFWGDFDARVNVAYSAHASMESAHRVAMTLGLPDSPPDDDGDWYEIQELRFHE